MDLNPDNNTDEKINQNSDTTQLKTSGYNPAKQRQITIQMTTQMKPHEVITPS
jgi:hypothetical protein